MGGCDRGGGEGRVLWGSAIAVYWRQPSIPGGKGAGVELRRDGGRMEWLSCGWGGRGGSSRDGTGMIGSGGRR